MAIKTALTFEEKVTAAYLHYAQGIDQHVIAMSMGVNMGRVNEACVAVRKALTPGSAPGNVTQLKEKRA
jgi:hypothetical protein